MSHFHLSKIVTPLTVGALIGAAVPSLRAGGGEIFCNFGGPEIQERWMNVPAAGIEWNINLALTVNHPCPGYPPISCATSSFHEMPGVQSLYRAAQIWNDAEVPGSPGSTVSTIAWDDPGGFGYNCCTPPSFLNSVNGLDDMNAVTLWEPSWSFTMVGGAGAVAVADVAIDFATGEILEADIAFNTYCESAPGVPCWSFVETNAFDGRTYASTSVDLTFQPFGPPSMGYIDLEGVAVHEFGHALGLGHSLVDGRQVPTESTTPTMFETAHTESFPDTLASHRVTGTCTFATTVIGGGQTPLGGLLGAGLKTLEPDDVAALGALYPSSDYATLTGSISGTVVDASNNPVRGAHVVAISTLRPNENRVGTLSLQNGVFQISGLEPDDYYVYVEPVDQGSGGLFDPASVPNYVYLVNGLGGGCISSVVQHQTEFWDDAEGVSESSPMAVSAVAVNAGLDTPGIDLVVEGLPDVLTVSTTTSSSNRGVLVAPAPGVDPVVTFTANFGVQNADRMARLILGPDHGKRMLGGILLQASQNGPPGWPIQQAVKTDAFGDVTFTVTITDGMAHHELIAQVAIRAHSGMPVQISNPVSVVIERP